jgi:hypothetical protein
MLDLLAQVDIKTYNMLADSDNSQKQIGFIAQNLETIFPSVVMTDSEGNKSVSYSALTPILTAAIKELNLNVNQIENFDFNPDGSDSTFVIKLRQWLASATNGIEDLFAKKIRSEQICLKKADGSEYCVNGDQLESVMNGQGTIVTTPPSGNDTNPDPITDPITGTGDITGDDFSDSDSNPPSVGDTGDVGSTPPSDNIDTAGDSPTAPTE